MSSPAPRRARGVRFPFLPGALLLALFVAAAGWMAVREAHRAASSNQRAAAVEWWQRTEAALRCDRAAPLPTPIPTAAQGETQWRPWIERTAARLQRPVCRVMDPRGRVLASAHWPASVGMPLTQPGAGEFWIVEEPLARRSRLALVTERLLGPEGGLRLVSGVFLDDPFFSPWRLARIGEETSPVLFVLPLEESASYGLCAADPPHRTGWAALAWIAGSVLIVFAGLLWAGRSADRALAGLQHHARRLFPEHLSATHVADPDALSQLLSELAHRRTRLAIRLQAARRLAGWRSAGRALAHEVRNALTPVRISLELATRAGGERPPNPELIREALQALGSAEVLLEEFSDFARLPQGIPRRIVLETWIPAVARRWAPARAIPLLGAGEAHCVAVDPARLERTVGNLLRNALEAAGEGALRIEVADPTAEVEGPAGERTYVRMTVWNAGEPIPAEIGARMFQGGATTKAGGSGLGLAIARSIALQLGGDLRYRNTPDGVAFDLWLPLADRDETPRRHGKGA
ncbi:MAG: HAMP domain-containing histidine kinase [Candidatus Eisenbacteria sp.]|nr:HAMP domain-containing histidine kinase [Candidatus Eisenbacteria bacterium]